MKRSISQISSRPWEDPEPKLTSIAEVNKTAEKKSSTKKIHKHHASLLPSERQASCKRLFSKTPEVEITIN